MADPYGLELSGLTPELSAEAAALARRQKVAEAMGMQAQQGLPVNRMAGNMAVAISPFEGAAQLLKAYSSRKALDDVDAKRQDISRRGREAVVNEVARIQGIGADKPGQVFQPATPNDDEGNAIPSAQGPTIPGDKNRMVTEAMMSSLPQVQKYGQVLSGQVQADKTLAATQEFQRAESRARAQDRLDTITMQLASREMEGEANRAARQQMQEQANQLRRELAELSNQSRRDIAVLAGSLRQPPAPSLTQIVDPKDPTKMITVDARTYRPGGSVGDPGVFGVAGKEPAAAKREEQASSGKDQVTSLVNTLRDAYTNLNAGGGIQDSNAGVLGNIGARLSSTGVGQAVGQGLGTKNQKYRDTIEQTRPLLLNAIKQATGMSAKQMDSNAEMKLWLAAATDPTKDVQSNLEALDKLDKAFGLSAGPPRLPQVPVAPNAPAAPAAPARPPAAGQVLRFDAQGNPVR